MISKNHHFFLLPASPWPLVSSVSAFNMMMSLIIFFKFFNYYNFIMSLMNLALISFSWWMYYNKEFCMKGNNSFILESGIKMSMILFISSEVLFFFSFFWSYFHFFLSPSMELGSEWPPFTVETFNCLNVPLINTLILMASGVTVTLSHNYMIESKFKLFNFYLVLTFLLGLFFSYLQFMEYQSAFFSISDSTFGTVFFMLTGFHGIHVFIGSLYLFTCFSRSLILSHSKYNFLMFEMSSWYWHFVDVVWIFLYFFIYYLNH